MDKLKARTAVSSIFIIGVVLITWALSFPQFHSLFVFIIILLGNIALWEFFQLAQKKHLFPDRATSHTLLTMLILAADWASQLHPSPPLVLSVSFIGASLLFCKRFKTTQHSLVSIAISCFGVAYIGLFCITLILLLYYLAPLTGTDPRLWFAYLILTTKSCDMAAYFVGQTWGSRQLAPLLSPKKTLEGALGAFLAAFIINLLFYFFTDFPFSFSLTLLLALLMGAGALLGDLAESLIKRDAQVKDSNQLPGLGGILDVLDSLLFTTPLLYLFLKTVSCCV